MGDGLACDFLQAGFEAGGEGGEGGGGFALEGGADGVEVLADELGGEAVWVLFEGVAQGDYDVFDGGFDGGALDEDAGFAVVLEAGG